MTSAAIAGNALASTIVPFREKVITLDVPAGRPLTAVIAARSDPVPESVRVLTAIENAPEFLEAARALPGLLRALSRRELRAARPAPGAPQLQELYTQLRNDGRRRDALSLGAVLLFGGLVWLAVAHPPLWPGWTLLAAGGAKIGYGLWRFS